MQKLVLDLKEKDANDMIKSLKEEGLSEDEVKYLKNLYKN